MYNRISKTRHKFRNIRVSRTQISSIETTGWKRRTQQRKTPTSFRRADMHSYNLTSTNLLHWISFQYSGGVKTVKIQRVIVKLKSGYKLNIKIHKSISSFQNEFLVTSIITPSLPNYLLNYRIDLKLSTTLKQSSSFPISSATRLLRCTYFKTFLFSCMVQIKFLL